MVRYLEALQIIERVAGTRHKQCGLETLGLLQCVGRYAAGDIYAVDPNPRFNNSAMDGYGLLSSQTRGASKDSPLTFRVEASLPAGSPPPAARAESAHSCIEIMCGAVIPDTGIDAVVRFEDVAEERDETGAVKYITLTAPVKPRENIRFAGEDLEAGRLLFPRGTRLDSQHLLALSMSGLTKLSVFCRPKVVILSTGNELVPFDAPEVPGHKIRNSTAPLLRAALGAYGADAIFLGIVADDSKKLLDALRGALEHKPDIIITTGGVSVGRFDLVASVLQSMEAGIRFHKVAIRPGKPILFAEFGSEGPVLFGLPGNPLAVTVGVRFFVQPYLRALLGAGREVAHNLPLAQDAAKPAGLSFFQRGVRNDSGVKVLPGQASFMVASLLKAEGWIVGAAEPALLKQGDLVEWYPLW